VRARALPAPAGANFNEEAQPPVGFDTNTRKAQLRGKECLSGLVRMDFRVSDFCGIGHFSSYAECERKLRQKGLVHPDGTLKLRLQLFIEQ
jgi:hypothetical protein